MNTFQKKMLILFPISFIESMAIGSGLILFKISALYMFVFAFQSLGILFFNAALLGRFLRWWK